MTKKIIVYNEPRKIIFWAKTISQTVYDTLVPFYAGVMWARTENIIFLIFLVIPIFLNWDVVTKKIESIK